jgi:hypothetical protein
LTEESFGYKDAETSDGTRVKADIDKRGSRILIIEWRGVVMSVGSYQVSRAPNEK